MFGDLFRNNNALDFFDARVLGHQVYCLTAIPGRSVYKRERQSRQSSGRQLCDGLLPSEYIEQSQKRPNKVLRFNFMLR